MAGSRSNRQMFALRRSPSERVMIDGRVYVLEKVFKHDFFAATTLYRAEAAEAPCARVVVKYGRDHGFFFIPGAWIGRLFLRREQRFHKRVDGVPGMQRWVGAISETAYALEYVEGRTLDLAERPVDGAVFDTLRQTLDALHARGAAYCDLNKRSNIVITPDGRPVLIDFQISVLLRDDVWPPRRWWLNRFVPYMQKTDLYHLYKHKRSLAADALTDAERALAGRRGVLIGLHRLVFTPLRRVRRWMLNRLYRAGKLASPTAHLEDHYQPEKATWRK